MGLYQRERGIYYLQVKEENTYKRISMKTKNKELAQRMYDNYLLSEISQKLNNTADVNKIQKQFKSQKAKLQP